MYAVWSVKAAANRLMLDDSRCDKSRKKERGKEGRGGFRTFVGDGGRTGDKRVDRGHAERRRSKSIGAERYEP